MRASCSKFLCTLLLFMVSLVLIQAQTTDRAKRRAENRANQRVDQKVDQAVDSTVDAIEGLFKKRNRNKDDEEEETVEEGTTESENPEENSSQEVENKEEEMGGGFLNGLSFGGEFEPYENPVRMNFSADITTTRRNKSDDISIDYTFDTWATAMKMTTEDGVMRILLDNQEGYMTTVTVDKNGESQGFKMRQRSVKVDESTLDDSEVPEYTITKTGNTRTIDGYFCEEYLMEHEESTTNMWATQEVDLEYKTMFEAMTAQYGLQKNAPSTNMQSYEMEGFPIEMTTVSANGKETTTIHFYDIKVGNDIDLSVFDLDGVEVMNAGF